MFSWVHKCIDTIKNEEIYMIVILGGFSYNQRLSLTHKNDDGICWYIQNSSEASLNSNIASLISVALWKVMFDFYGIACCDISFSLKSSCQICLRL